MKKISLAIAIASIVIFGSCSKSDSDTPAQTIVTSDSSDVSGRLYVDVYNDNGNSRISNAIVSLYLSYDDVKRDIPLYSFTSNSSGRVDFGYILQGNYYITGRTGQVSDSTVAQILPRRTVTRKLYLR